MNPVFADLVPPHMMERRDPLDAPSRLRRKAGNRRTTRVNKDGTFDLV